MATGFATHVPKMASDEGVVDAAKAAIGEALLGVKEDVGEIRPTVRRESIVDVLRAAGFRLGTSG
jgi:NADH-quinone oxidoreductase subunit C